MSGDARSLTEDLPGRMPEDERPLWSGGPDGASLARHALHVRKVAVYFALLLAWRLLAVWRDGFSVEAAINASLTTAALALAVVAALRAYAWASARSTDYAITTKRVIIRTGVALPITINVPFSKIERVDVKRRDGGGGDIEITLIDGERVGYVILWPSAKPFHPLRVRPMLRALADVDTAAATLSSALQAHVEAGGTATPATHDDSHGMLLAG